MSLFTFANAKTSKGEVMGYRTAILYLAPADIAGANLCKFSTAECRELCLNTAGRGAFTSTQNARIRKTKSMHLAPMAFFYQLHREVESLVKWCASHGMMPCVRLNGTSDIYTDNHEALINAFPFVQFYDYTKDTKRMDKFMCGDLPLNYHLTYSFSGTQQSLRYCDKVIQNGFNVAVVFDCKREKPLLTHWRSYRVKDGDTHDLRFLDKPFVEDGAYGKFTEGVVVGLRAKGKARKSGVTPTSFVQANISSNP